MIEFRNPVFTKDSKKINCEINHPEHGWIPFTCNPNDKGSSIDVTALYDKMGKFATHYKPRRLDKEEMSMDIRSIRDRLLVELDYVIMNPLRWNAFSSSQQEDIAVYRQQLLDVPQQKDFPNNIDWPSKPSCL